ncbi:hypothetical protein Tco_0173727 [Tanacetum coccineum]
MGMFGSRQIVIGTSWFSFPKRGLDLEICPSGTTTHLAYEDASGEEMMLINKNLVDQTPLERDSGYDGRSEITAYCGNMTFLYGDWYILKPKDREAMSFVGLWLDGGHDRSWWRRHYQRWLSGFFLDSWKCSILALETA